MKRVYQLHQGLSRGVAPLCELPDLVRPVIHDGDLVPDKPPSYSKEWGRRNGRANGYSVAPAKSDDDTELVTQCRVGNRQAFDQLVLRHKDRLYTLACRLVGDHGEAEDITQDAFLRAYERLDEFRGEAKFSTWLYRICYNLCLNSLNKKKNDPRDGFSAEAEANQVYGASEPLLRKEQQNLIHWALSCVKWEFREVVLLYYTEQLSYDEIASLIGHPVGTVRSRLHRGREELKELLRPYWEKDRAPKHFAKADS